MIYIPVMSSNDIIYAPVKKRGIFIPDWGKIPVYLNVVSPGVLSGIASVGFNGQPMPGIHFAVAEQCNMDVLSKELYSSIKFSMNMVPAQTIEYRMLNMRFKHGSSFDQDGRTKLLNANCNTVEDNGWGSVCVYGQKFYDLQNVPHDMVDDQGNVHPGLIELTKSP